MSRMSLSFSAESTKAASSRRAPGGRTATPGATAAAGGAAVPSGTAADSGSAVKHGHSGIPLAQPKVWLRQMLGVDFGHAFWPWLVYLLGVAAFLFYRESTFSRMLGMSVESIWAFALVAVTSPAVIVRIFCTDFGHGTAERLLVAPVPRMTIWWARYALATLLLLIPLGLCLAALPPHILRLSGSPLWRALQYISAAFSTVFIHLTVGMLCVMLRRPLLVWSAMVISPALMSFLLLLVNAIVTEFEPSRLGSLYFLPWYMTLLCLAAIPIAARLWRRLEVRS